MEWLANNWIWIALGTGIVGFYMFSRRSRGGGEGSHGGGCCGGGGHGRGKATKPARERAGDAAG